MENIKYDVFLSRKSEDAHLAKEIYDFLTEKGLKVFDSDHSLQEMGNADYSRAIDDVLVSTEHLLVVGNSIENINSPWVESEWRFFLNRKRSGKVKGNLITVTGDNLNIEDLPPSLQNYEVIQIKFDYLLKLYKYVSKKKPNNDNKIIDGQLENLNSEYSVEYFKKNLSGVWYSQSSKTYLYAIEANQQLLICYCYGGNNQLSSHYFNFRVKEKYLLAEFSWFNQIINGYSCFEVIDNDSVKCSWWYSKDIGFNHSADLFSSLITYGFYPQNEHTEDFIRVKDMTIYPSWVMHYFETVSYKKKSTK